MFSSTGMEAPAQRFELDVAGFPERTRPTPSEFGERAVGDRKLAGDVRRGRSPRLVTVDRARAFMYDCDRAHRPDRAGDRSFGQRQGSPGDTDASGSQSEVDR